MSSYQIFALITCALAFHESMIVTCSSDPYTFKELIEKNLINSNSGAETSKTLFKDSDDPKLKFDYDFSLADDEKIVIHERDAKWNEEMSEARNEIKDARMRQMEAYRKFGAVLFDNEDNKDENVRIAKAKIAEEDEGIGYYFAACADLEDAAIEDSDDDDSDDDDSPAVSLNYKTRKEWIYPATIPREFKYTSY